MLLNEALTPCSIKETDFCAENSMKKYSWITIIALIWIAFLPMMTILCAQESLDTSVTEETTQQDESFIGLIKASGVIGMIIILLSVVALAFIIEDFVSLQYKKLIPSEILDDIEKLLDEEAYEDVLELCNTEPCLLTAPMGAAMDQKANGFERMSKAAQNSIEEEVVKLQQKISWLQLIAALAPMLGLLGTVWGMILAFQQIAAMTRAPQPRDLAFGIYQALMTTYLGLIVAIACLVLYFYFRNKVVRITMELSGIVEEMLDRFRR